MTQGRKKGARSPAMEQFFRAKEEHPDAILFFRLGDFYEMFFEDAVLASQLIDLTLTSRGADENGVAIPMAGVPHHAASGYIARLLEQGQRVAICEQMADPSKVKGIVPRQVVRVVTPALVLDPDALDARARNPLLSVVRIGERFGLCALELGAAEARATELESQAEVLAELVRCDPREILIHEALGSLDRELARVLPKAARRALPDASLAQAETAEALAPLLGEGRAAGLSHAALVASAVALKYALDAQPGTPLDVQRILAYDTSAQLSLDDAAVRNLELVTTLSGERKGSLLHCIDGTACAMGARLLRQRLLSPLTQVEPIRRRHDAVQAFFDDALLRARVRTTLQATADLERLATRTSLGVASPRDLGAIRSCLARAEELSRALSHDGTNDGTSAIDDTLRKLAPEDLCEDVKQELAHALVDEPPLSSGMGGIFRDELDVRVAELRELGTSGKDVLLRLEERERARTGIPSLKIRYTKVFGYYIEITRAKAGSVPSDYRRKQTVAGGERFTTDELDELQAKIQNADERVRALEAELFAELRARIGKQAPRLRRLAQRIAEIDVHAALAETAQRYDFVRPEVEESTTLELQEARHPIVERVVPRGSFVPNDVRLDADGERLMVITGPNMAGKSTTMRQVALAVILAQCGSFVPAKHARIGLVDRIYTRVGASDNLAAGQSTFMVEMRETANILRGATRKSLVILDEIGRGTSTYDGVAIAWAVAEYLHDVVGCRGMFATHYHELCDLADVRTGVVNFNVAAREHGDEVIFLHQLTRGAANRSYGVAVARLAGVPEIVLARARSILRELESGQPSAASHPRVQGREHGRAAQLDMFGERTATPRASECEATLREIDIDRMTPIEALNALSRLKALLPPK